MLKTLELVPAARDPRWAAALGARYHESGTPARAATSLPCAKLGSKRKSLRTGSPLSPWNESMAWRQPNPGAENPGFVANEESGEATGDVRRLPQSAEAAPQLRASAGLAFARRTQLNWDALVIVAGVVVEAHPVGVRPTLADAPG